MLENSKMLPPHQRGGNVFPPPLVGGVRGGVNCYDFSLRLCVFVAQKLMEMNTH